MSDRDEERGKHEEAIEMPDGALTAEPRDAMFRFFVLDRAERRDWHTAKVIYQALALRRRFGTRMAYIFLTTRRVPSKLGMRVLTSKDNQLRR